MEGQQAAYNKLFMPGLLYSVAGVCTSTPSLPPPFLSLPPPSLPPSLELVVSLDASNEFLKERVINLPQSKVAGTHNTEEGEDDTVNTNVYCAALCVHKGSVAYLFTIMQACCAD